MNDSKLCPQCGTRYDVAHRFCTLDGATLMSTAPRADLVGSVIADRYLVKEKLGDGGMGQVYLAEHVRMKRKCAVKVMRPGLMNDPDAISRFNREAENASQVFHPNVAAVYDFGEANDGMIYLAMEYVDGESLAKLVEREKAVHPVRAAEIIKQAADALDVAHGLGILHRDLKPENIMIARTRDRLDLVKIVDFGIARAMTSESQRVTRTGSMVGTPEYMSPEQFAGDELDARTDIYSLALVAFNMLTGASAYPSGTSKDNLIVRLTKPPRRLHEVKDLPWPEELQNTFDKALASNPADRYSSVLDFSRDMTAAIASMPSSQTGEIYLSALASALAARTSSTPSRSPALTPSTSQSSSAVTSDDVVPTVTTAPPKKRSSAIIVGSIAAVVVLGLVAWQASKKTAQTAATGSDAAQLASIPATGDSLSPNAALPAGGAAPSEQDVFNSARNGVVSITSDAGVGVGFLADASGLIVTASHLVPKDGAPFVIVNDTLRLRARTVLNDSAKGVAVLAIARTRCPKCTPLNVAVSDSGAAAVDSATVIVVGAQRPGLARMVKGQISTLDARVLHTTAKPGVTEGGAPILTLAGTVIGIAIAPQGKPSEVHFVELQNTLVAAKKVVAQAGFVAPSDTLLPMRPRPAFPAEPIAAVASQANFDIKKYRADRDNVHLFVMTPQVMAWREARAQAALAARKPAAGASSAPAKMDPIQAWKGWDGCIKDRCAVVVLNAVPDNTEYPFHKPTEVVGLKYGSVASITLLRDGVPVEPIESAVFPAVLNQQDYIAKKEPVLNQGIAMYRAREFAPRPGGGTSRFEVVITDATRPGRPIRLALETATIQAIIYDFTPYGLTR